MDTDSNSQGLIRSAQPVSNVDMLAAPSGQGTNLIYVSQQDLAPVLQHLQNQQFAILENISRQQNSSLIKTILVVFILVFLLGLSIAIGLYKYMQPIENVQKEVARSLSEYQSNIDQQFLRELHALQKKYQTSWEQLSSQSQSGYQQLFGFFQRLQNDYQQELAEEQNRKLVLLQRQETLEKTVQELMENLTKSEITILHLREENKQLKDKQSQLQKTIAHQKEEIVVLKKQAVEKLTPEELDRIRRELERDE